jgi:hypothetical protein
MVTTKIKTAAAFFAYWEEEDALRLRWAICRSRQKAKPRGLLALPLLLALVYRNLAGAP